MPKPTWTGKSPWTIAMEKLQVILFNQYNLRVVSNDAELRSLFDAIMDIYDVKNASVGNVQSTDNLVRMMNLSFTIYNLSDTFKRDLRININRGAAQYQLDNDLSIKQAPVVPIELLMELAWKLWSPETTEKVQRGSLYKRRAAATILALCTFTGNRWIDSCRLRWEDLKMEKEQGLWFVFFKMRVNKTTFSKRRPIWCSLYATDEQGLCAVELLLLWWEFSGCKQHGFLFPDRDSHDNGDAPFHQMRKIAKSMRLAVLPSRHTPRNTLVASMFQLGYGLDAIRRKFNWVVTSEMPHHYLSYKLDKIPTSIARTLALSLKSKDLDFQNDFMNI